MPPHVSAAAVRSIADKVSKALLGQHSRSCYRTMLYHRNTQRPTVSCWGPCAHPSRWPCCDFAVSPDCGRSCRPDRAD